MGITADQLVALKARIKAEMARRRYYGSLSTDNAKGAAAGPTAQYTDYSSTAYDFTTTPVAGGLIKAEHGEKTINLLNKIKAYPNLTNAAQGVLIPSGFDYTNLVSILDTLEGEAIAGNSTSCTGACTGLCKGSCASTASAGTSYGSYCDGCSATCGSGCASSCARGSTGDSTPTCSGSCINTCFDACLNNCGASCQTGCSATCGGCSGCSGCGGADCTSQCSGCSGCSSGCSNSCLTACTTNCYAAAAV